MNGYGKTVFPRASKLNTLFALTVRRSDSEHLLMGRTILRYHNVDGVQFAPDGLFGLKSASCTLPISDAEVLDEFRRDFGLQRTDHPGLSVVVPYCDGDITPKTILEAVATEYFYPILSGRLVVEITSGSEQSGSTLNASTLLGSVNDEELIAAIKLAAWANAASGESLSELVRPKSRAPAWDASMFPDGGELARRFERGEPLVLQLPLEVPTSRSEWAPSSLRIVLQRDKKGRGYPPIFIRNGIIIPGAAERRVRGQRIFSLVLIDDDPLGRLLADAETPAHTQWSHQTQNFRAYGPEARSFLEFVRTAPRKVAEILSGAHKNRDRLALADFFPEPSLAEGVPDEDDADSDPKGDQPPGKPKNLVARPQAFSVERLTGGFRVRRGDTKVALPPSLEIVVAYDVSRGNPFSKYESADFDLKTQVESLVGAQTVTADANRIRVALLEEDFRIECVGFDVNRDLCVRVRAARAEDD